MANVMLATRQTATDVLSTVSSVSTVIASGARSISNLTSVAEALSSAYLERTKKELELSASELEVIAYDRADLRIARARMEIDAELKGNAQQGVLKV